ncbi:MAG TPA: 3-isopropylmalate dehydrogenase [Woeseiaceae bacterium]|nr:3-isopropylmalate dehydrogenase [Woeseiaceae bacterium]
MRACIACLPGDGIGPEVSAEAVRLLDAVAEAFGHRFELEQGLIGGAAIDAEGDPLPPATRELCERADAVLLGAVGGPKWSDPDATVRPEQGLLKLRAALGVYANLRPVKPHTIGARYSPLRPSLLRNVDILFVRELTGGSYFGEKRREGDTAFDACRYSVAEIERATRRAGELARSRRGKLTHVDKANVLETSRLWRATVTRVIGEEFPEVALEHVLVDAMAMHLLMQPAHYDVILTENLFGDILTDEASVLAGSMGLLPSASLGDGRRGLYEPIHGAAPDIAGRGIANPYAILLSVALLLRHSLLLETEAQVIERAVSDALDARVLTRDLAARGAVDTRTAGGWVAQRVHDLADAARRVA